MEVIDIVDNFLPEDVFNPLFDLLSSWNFPWYFNDFVVDENPSLDNYQFTHTFINSSRDIVHTPFISFISPIIEKLNVKKLERVKANLNTRTSNHIEGGYHVDTDNNITTSILYMNTNNGWTEFKGGDKIDCVQNRIVTFNSNMMHTGYTCTDQKRKMVINFNYGKN
mgnify:FL=1|tara:strand:+ start:42 stop:542 length:501 start_codon:yes stop_codon:yes gene_type:complete